MIKNLYYYMLGKYLENVEYLVASLPSNKKRFLDKTFTFQNKQYNYLFAKYGYVWRNERAVELPIIKRILDDAGKMKILEVGNVVNHYYKNKITTVIDKYEKQNSVLNIDIVDFKEKDTYDLIISISTIEHVGFDEKIKDPDKPIKTVEILKKGLKVDGRIFITVPIGYNPTIDHWLKSDSFSKKGFMKRISKNNDWIETTQENALGCKYGTPFNNANAIAILEIKKMQ